MEIDDLAVLDAAKMEHRQNVHRRALDLETHNPVPLLIAPYNMWYVTADRLDNVALDLEKQVAMRERQNLVDDYSIPHLKPGTGLGAIPAAFGCEWRAADDADPWIIPIITKDNPQDVYKLAMPDPKSDGQNPLFFQRVAYFEEHSALPLQTCNIPSPLTSASMIWNYSDFAIALIEHPKEVHHLLDLVTEYTIAFLRQQMAAMPNLWALSHMNWYIPPEYGLRVSDDVLAVLSPDQYGEFGVQYNNRLSREFGGIVVHSCGNIVHNLSTIIEQTEGLRGIELTLPHNDILKVKQLAAGKTALMMRYWNFDWEDSVPPHDLVEFTESVFETLGTRGIMLEMQAPTATTAEAIDLANRFKAKEFHST
ncbi:MAG: hypothetical protein GY759_04030 [Chloroflexi bacterium]|nr:hypothetical protein [Chloroflexota bacterium]